MAFCISDKLRSPLGVKNLCLELLARDVDEFVYSHLLQLQNEA